MLIKLSGAIGVCFLVQNNRGLMIIFLSEIGHRIKANQIWMLVPPEVLISLIMCVINTVASCNGLPPDHCQLSALAQTLTIAL